MVHPASKVKAAEAVAWVQMQDPVLALVMAVEVPLEVTELQTHTTIILTTTVAAEAAVEEFTTARAAAQAVKVELAEDHGNNQVVLE